MGGVQGTHIRMHVMLVQCVRIANVCTCTCMTFVPNTYVRVYLGAILPYLNISTLSSKS